MIRNPFRRPVKVIHEVTTRTVKVNPNTADYANVATTVRALGRQYVALAREVEPLVEQTYSREYFWACIGRQNQIAKTIAMLTGKDSISVGASLDRGRVYDGHGNLIDLGLGEAFDSLAIVQGRKS